MIWSSDFAYAVGLISTDGCLSKDGRHIDLTSKDLEQIENFRKILKLTNKIGFKNSGTSNRKYYRIEFGNVKLYRYLESIGLSQRKSKILNELNIPNKYFADFLRGCFDGDGYSYSYWSRQYPNSFVFYTGFCSASSNFLNWIKNKTEELYHINGYIKIGGNKKELLLMFAKHNSINLIKIMYYSERVICLKRKKFKIETTLDIIHKQAEVVKLADTPS